MNLWKCLNCRDGTHTQDGWVLCSCVEKACNCYVSGKVDASITGPTFAEILRTTPIIQMPYAFSHHLETVSRPNTVCRGCGLSTTRGDLRCETCQELLLIKRGEL